MQISINLIKKSQTVETSGGIFKKESKMRLIVGINERDLKWNLNDLENKAN